MVGSIYARTNCVVLRPQWALPILGVRGSPYREILGRKVRITTRALQNNRGREEDMQC